ncbi:MAG TPA: sigma-54 dependent transcriptional regulator [Candidatus Krumholzibacteria bacterium]|jgi:two-component system nitrogen regulation response regulator NtrX
MTVGRILIADDETAIRQSVGSILRYEDYEVLEASDGPLALEAMRREGVDVLLLDVKMPGMDGFEVMSQMHAESLAIPVVVISGHDAVSTAVEAIRRGALDFLEKPFKKEALLVRVQNALAHGRLQRENRELRAEAGLSDELLGDSIVMREINELIDKVAPTPARVLITGENGTGKELVARAIHRLSERKDGPFVEVNCAAIPEELIESELFGHEKGSFTGAGARRLGKFERAHGGTLFLDEIGDMSANAQAKVLRALQESRIERVGAQDPVHVDVRVVAATNRNLEDPTVGFRQDLYFRLNVIQLHMPPLRERGNDIPALFGHFLQLAAQEMKNQIKVPDADTLAALARHNWPGNVRELRNLAERLAIVVSGDRIRRADLPPGMGGREVERGGAEFLDVPTFNEFKDASEAAYIQRKLKLFDYNISRTAEELQMQRSNLYKKIQKYGLRTSGGN